ncbi:hypothetical protein HPB49_023451 [Dermacentor silvarum]|uniref:Uncharacterized protein n=1 Tax=Dermacentor silvarum TaxID=543639 RepID=A0ACB8CI63_DERSI|nr:uncharacterized protein LOC119459571 isoform X2 [Dermacentor silvarum]KAH7942361.1 hypothetical protein HPB49_023451 [Dermacentor silvarum]
MWTSLNFGLFLLLPATLLGTCKAHLKSGCKIETLRNCGEDYVPYLKTQRMSDTPQQLAKECAKYKRQIACALHFHHDCTRGRSQAAALATIAALGENMEAVCTPGSGPNKDYLRGVKCMNYVGDKLHTCFANLKSAVQRAVFKAPAKEALHYTCCAYHDVTECISQTLAPCHRVGATEFLVGIMERVVGTALRPACATHTKGSDACKALKPLAQLGAKDFVVDSLIELLAEAGSTIGRRP